MTTPPPNGTGSDANEQPRYGRRAEDEPGYVPSNPDPSPQPGTPADPAGGFTPGYAASTSSSDSAYASSNQAYPGGGAQYGAPGSNYGANGSGYASPVAPPQLPGRGGAITLIVVGLLCMLVVAPFTFFGFIGYTASKSVIPSLQDGTQVDVVKGTDVQVQNGILGVVVAPANDSVTCMVSGSQGTTELPKNTQASNQDSMVFMSQNLPDGNYRLTCKDLPQGASAAVIDSSMIGDVLGGALTGLIVSSIIGLVGLVLLIWGIVRLVRTNRRRREIQMNAMMGY